ncbi:hypothetical protein BU23DRAFT_575286 [Bimuria novae-zelandiae CBS 107.79]|uniref:Uncharacterized protein n=1 Tax=Bimuria novae-zelandiae CBS 107.79 TaxID=1447943 RepID=A0A6A5UPX1_9PLEO|nr:hypothetical protein BU23DRAFT_575286 [Bimuria novae-zelandiae CBS 107.79]
MQCAHSHPPLRSPWAARNWNNTYQVVENDKVRAKSGHVLVREPAHHSRNAGFLPSHHPHTLTTSLAFALDRCDTTHPILPCSAIPSITAYRTPDCRPTHIFVTRSTDEVAPGRLGNITVLICSALGGAAHYGYGRAKRASAVSTGATVTQDLLGGGGGALFGLCGQENNVGLEKGEAPGGNAVVTFGTVRRSLSEPYSVGPGKDFRPEAVRTEEQKEELNQYADMLRDYYNAEDEFCAKESRPLDLEFHLKYFEELQRGVVDWVVETHANKGSVLPMLIYLYQRKIHGYPDVP